MTSMEKLVYEAAKEDTRLEYSTDINQLASLTGLSKNQVKGVVGSLVKKGYMEVEKESRNNMVFYDIFPIVDGELWSFADDNDLT